MSVASTPRIPITADWIESLLVRGWTIQGVRRRFGYAEAIEFRDPQGISGSEYQISDFREPFPEVVSEWILDNVPRTFIGGE